MHSSYCKSWFGSFTFGFTIVVEEERSASREKENVTVDIIIISK